MIALMAPKKQRGPRPRPDSKRTLGVDRHTQPRLAFHMPAALFDRFKAHVAALKPRPNESEVLRVALEQYLDAVGAPPAPGAGEGE